jgi:hypothetical protein
VRARVEWDGSWSIYIPEFRRWLSVPAYAVGPPDKFNDGRSHVCLSGGFIPESWAASKRNGGRSSRNAGWHHPGTVGTFDKLFVDYAGDTVPVIVDRRGQGSQGDHAQLATRPAEAGRRGGRAGRGWLIMTASLMSCRAWSSSKGQALAHLIRS